MSVEERTVDGERLEPAAAFEIIGSETRLMILRVLFEEKYRAVTFSELRERVGLRDGSQFNFHLKKLVGPFVRKTEEGYLIRHAGLNVMRTIVEGPFTDHPRIPPFEIDGSCVACGESLQAAYDHEMVFVDCAACGRRHTMGMFPPSGVSGRSEQEVITAFDQWYRFAFELTSRGVCFQCCGRTTGSFVPDSRDIPTALQDIDAADLPPSEIGIIYECEHCDVWDFATPGQHILSHPEVVAVHREHGIDLAAVPHWELDWVVGTERTCVLAEDPLRVMVTISLPVEEIRVTLDERFAVLDVDRVPTDE